MTILLITYTVPGTVILCVALHSYFSSHGIGPMFVGCAGYSSLVPASFSYHGTENTFADWLLWKLFRFCLGTED